MLRTRRLFAARWQQNTRIQLLPLHQSLLLATSLALIWWIVAYYLRLNDAPILIWDDQMVTFLSGLSALARPNDIAGFTNPPWALIPLIPFKLMPLPLAVLGQLTLYFALMALVIFKFGGGRWALILTLTSPIALDSALELNIDWIVLIGLLVPQAYSAPFLLVKPQSAPGYLLSLSRKQLIQTACVSLGVLLISFLLWGFWIPDYLAAARFNSVSWLINMAPMNLIGAPTSLFIGVIFAAYAFRKRDALLCILAGYFFVPYLASYSLLLPFALIACRWRWLALAISTGIWLQVFIIVALS